MLKISVQRATRQSRAPTAVQLRAWARQILRDKNIFDAELTIRIVNSAEMTTLNSTYRHTQGATNVLSFPFEMPEETLMDIPLLGDIVICAEIVNQEARAQHKKSDAHWAHMVVHGVLHLLGHDHGEENEAQAMEALEINTLKTLGFNNPYEEQKGTSHE